MELIQSFQQQRANKLMSRSIPLFTCHVCLTTINPLTQDCCQSDSGRFPQQKVIKIRIVTTCNDCSTPYSKMHQMHCQMHNRRQSILTASLIYLHVCTNCSNVLQSAVFYGDATHPAVQQSVATGNEV